MLQSVNCKQFHLQEYADQLQVPFLETSAKYGTNVEQVFMTMAAEIIKNMENTGAIEKEREVRFGILSPLSSVQYQYHQHFFPRYIICVCNITIEYCHIATVYTYNVVSIQYSTSGNLH